MASIQDDILAAFLDHLKVQEDFTEEIVEELRTLLSGPKKAKAADIEKALTPEEHEASL